MCCYWTLDSYRGRTFYLSESWFKTTDVSLRSRLSHDRTGQMTGDARWWGVGGSYGFICCSEMVCITSWILHVKEFASWHVIDDLSTFKWELVACFHSVFTCTWVKRFSISVWATIELLSVNTRLRVVETSVVPNHGCWCLRSASK